MIRINLHPVRQIKKVQAGKRQLLVFALIVVGELALMALLYSWRSGMISDKEREIVQLNARIEALKKEVGDFDKLKAQRERLIAQRNIINTLQNARTGPVLMMRELSDILTKGKGPTVNQAAYEQLLRRDPGAGYNPRWNPNRLWIEGLVEKDKKLRIVGKAKDYDDVAEFNKRIHLSKYFKDDFLERNSQMMDRKLGLKVVRFELRCRVTY
jgi:type IV pilus assembly protein PilN